MPGVFVFTRTKDGPTALFAGPRRNLISSHSNPIGGENMVNISITDVQGLLLALNGKAPVIHNHTIEQVDDLEAALDEKVAANDVQAALVAYTEAVGG